MVRLDDHIAPNEPVLWRSMTVREYLVDLTKSFGWAFVASLLLAIVFRNWSGLILALVAPGIMCLVAWDNLVPAPDRVSLTSRQFLVRRGYRRIRPSALTRKHIVGLEIFEGDGTLLLHGRHGELDRIRFLGDPLDLARELDLPTCVWHPHEPPKPAGRRRVVRILSWFVIPGTILAFAFGGTFGVLATIDVYLGPDYIRDTFSKDAVGFVAMILLGMALPAGWVVGQVVMGGMRRLVMTPEDLALLRCERTDPLWQGEMPPGAPRPGLGAAIHALRRGYYRLAYGHHTDSAPPVPKRFEPGAIPPPKDVEEDAAPS